MFSLLSGRYLKVELLGHMTNLCVTFNEIVKLLSKVVVYYLTFSRAMYKHSNFSPSSPKPECPSGYSHASSQSHLMCISSSNMRADGLRGHKHHAQGHPDGRQCSVLSLLRCILASLRKNKWSHQVSKGRE